MTGLAPEQLSDLLPFWKRMRKGVFVDVALQGWLNRKSAEVVREVSGATPQAKISSQQLLSLFDRLTRTLKSLKGPNSGSHWINYETSTFLTKGGLEFKDRFITEALAQASPRTVLDMGANTGRYSIMACQTAEAVIALEQDAEVVDALYHRAASDRGTSGKVLPLVMDLLDPSPRQGWAQEEREGIASRAQSDFCLSLALIHHLTVSGNLPIDRILDWIGQMAGRGVIEFVPKSDPGIQAIMRWRQDTFGDYTRENFEAQLSKRFAIIKQVPIPDSPRWLYSYDHLR